MTDDRDEPDWAKALRRLCERESPIKCRETCKHVRETIGGELYCFDPAQGCNEAECIGNITLVCDNWVIASDKGTKTIVIKAE